MSAGISSNLFIRAITRHLSYSKHQIYRASSASVTHCKVYKTTTPSTSMAKRDASHLAAAATAKKPKQNGSITSFFGAPKVKVTKFDKSKWVATLTQEQKELLQLEIDTLHESWLAHLKDEIVTKEFLDLKRFLKKQRESGVTVFPPPEDIYSWYDDPKPSLIYVHTYSRFCLKIVYMYGVCTKP